MDKTLVNILGAGRSGTTMLDLMLGNDDESFSLGEVHAWFRPFRKHHFEIDCNCGDVNCKYWQPIKGLSQSKFHALAFEKLGVNFLIDSSKSLPWVIDNNKWANRNGIKVVNIVIYKPLINYIYSIWKRGESVDAALYRYGLYYSRFFETGLLAYAVSFDELVSNPVDVLDKLCEITGQKKREDREKFWEKESHHLFGSGGVRKQTQNTQSEIQKKESFPEGFLAILPAIKEKINADKKLKDLEKKLQTIDYKGGGRSLKSSKVHVKRPLWYYQLKAKNTFRGYFPEKTEVKF